MVLEYIIYKIKNKGYTLYMQRGDQDKLDTFSFERTNEISNHPQVARVAGTVEYNNSSPTWLTYHKDVMLEDYSLYEKGTVDILDDNDKALKLKLNGTLGRVDGSWILRNGNEDKVLMWKPISENEQFSCPCKVQLEEKETTIEKECFSMPLTVVKKRFRGTMMAAGVYTSEAARSTLFTDQLIKRIYEKYKNKPKAIRVDFNHQGETVGEVEKLEFTTEPVHRIIVHGTIKDDLPQVRALSITGAVSKYYDRELKTMISDDVNLEGVSVLTGNPGCSICYLEKEV